MVKGGNGVGSGVGGPPPGYMPEDMHGSIHPLEPGGQNQQSGQGPNTGQPLESCVLVVTDVDMAVIPDGKVVYTGSPEVERLGVGASVRVPVKT